MDVTLDRRAEETACLPPRAGRRTVWLQTVTIGWMLMELGVAGYAAVSARSPVMLAFGADSLVEVLSAVTVLLQWSPWMQISETSARRAAGVLLCVLAFVVAVTAVAALALGVQPAVTSAGLGITLAALLVMPVLARLKRTEGNRLSNAAMKADATQAATCAYLALTAIVGMGTDALFHIHWMDSAAALAAVPLLVIEGRQAWRGNGCGCC